MLKPIQWRSGRLHPPPPPSAPHHFDTTKIPERRTMRPKLMMREALKLIDLEGFRVTLQRRKRLWLKGKLPRTVNSNIGPKFDPEGTRWMMQGAELDVTIYGRRSNVRYAPYRESPDVPIGHVKMTLPKMGATFSVVRSVDLHWLLCCSRGSGG